MDPLGMLTLVVLFNVVYKIGTPDTGWFPFGFAPTKPEPPKKKQSTSHRGYLSVRGLAKSGLAKSIPNGAGINKSDVWQRGFLPGFVRQLMLQALKGMNLTVRAGGGGAM